MSNTRRQLTLAICLYSICFLKQIVSNPIVEPSAELCVNNNENLQTSNKIFYVGDYFVANFFRAAQFCTYHGMELATITSQNEENQLEELITSFGYGETKPIGFWIGGTTIAEKKKFYWLPTGAPLTYTNWGPNEPNDVKNAEDCVHIGWLPTIKKYIWNDIDCNITMYFICQSKS